MNSIKTTLKNGILSARLRMYRKIYIPLRAFHIRHKKKITVLFAVANLGAWKSEYLYKAMLQHPRFNPILLIGRSGEEDDVINLKSFCAEKGYEYVERENIEIPLWQDFHPDIIFYQKPYGSSFVSNLRSLFCYVPYAFHNSIEDWAFKTAYIYNCWQVYYENKTLRDYYNDHLGRGIRNGYATGIPPMDELTSNENCENPWKGPTSKKRIIYAPHHSINADNWWKTATFMKTGELMLELAKKYSDRVQWAFKPHPLLRGKLEKVWGKEKTDTYYAEWKNAEWSQYETGKYLGLFKYSDAMIHDCGSFIEEYHVTGNPVMFLIDPANKDMPVWNDTYEEAFQLHHKGFTIESIESFIESVINNETDLSGERKKRISFFKTNLVSPYGRPSCDNIMDCILKHDAPF